ncbi:MAG: YaaC family protein [Methylocystis sp.]|uniref:YaaC family protein n=1 Tax=Methylocystis sp. TaxID=1911079 RepID=UPI003DA59DBA
MPKSDWYDIKFLESAANAREVIRRSNGRNPSATVARDVSVCIQQGRLFFEAAADAPIQIKPLLLYYGVVAFAQAVVTATKCASLCTLTRSHGLSDVTPGGAKLENLELCFQGAGTFCEFNDTIAPLGRIWYFDNMMPRWFEKAFDLSKRLCAQKVTIKEVLARMPGLSDMYQQTFGSSAANLSIQLHFDDPLERCTLRIDDPYLYTDRDSLITAIQNWRSAYPFLNQWRFVEASHAWGSSILIFDNAKKDLDDLSHASLVHGDDNRIEAADGLVGGSNRFVAVSDILPPLSGGYVRAGATHVMLPLTGAMLPEYSLQFLGSFLLSSLVRYRPQIWQQVISRSITEHGTADDRALSLIEAFLDDTLISFPRMVVRVIDLHRTA